MIKYLKIVACTAVAMAFASPASAEVINLYDLRNFLYFGSTNLGRGVTGKAEVYKCNASDGNYSTPPSGYDCERKEYGSTGVRCYTNCKCSKSVYPFDASLCAGDNFVVPTSDDAKCTDSTGSTYYKTCSCTLNSLTSDHMGYFNTDNGKITIAKRNGGELVCYNPENFTCKSGYAEIPASEVDEDSIGGNVVTSKVEPVNYEVVANISIDDNLSNPKLHMCVKGATVRDPAKLDASSMTKKCAEVGSAMAKHYNYTYYYYTGNRKTGSSCELVSGDCVANATDHVTAYYPGTNTTEDITITYTTGCDRGWHESYFCTYVNAGASSSIYSGITKTVVSNISGKDCVKVTGCEAGYTQVAFTHEEGVTSTMNAALALNAAKQPDETMTYDAGAVNSYTEFGLDNYSYIICRIPTGCKTTNSSGQPICDMNTAWGGWLKCFN